MNILKLSILIAILSLSKTGFSQSGKDNLTSAQKQLEKELEQLKENREQLKNTYDNEKASLDKEESILLKEIEDLKKDKIESKKEHEELKRENRIIDTLKHELLKDGLVQRREHYKFNLNYGEIMVNGQKQPDSVHKRYIKLIESIEKKPFGENEEWNIKSIMH